MKSILEEFVYVNISPQSQFFKQNSEYGREMLILSKNEQKLLDRLGEEDKILLQKYIDLQGKIGQLTAVKNLIYGYKLGLIMTAEAFIKSDDLIFGEED